jgi:RimJ/RimL family protein N-acetyltransferase
MHAATAIRVAPITPDLREAMLRLRVRPEQDDFVSPVAVTLPDAEQCDGSTPMAILLGDTPVGYYRIEHSARSIVAHTVEADTLGLRSFQIDARWQGRHLGTDALTVLLADLAARHPKARRILLTVNCRNAAALALYRGAGFEDSDELYHGGRSGPQHLLWRDLP